MAISASQVKELRNKTGAGMMDCKKALTEAEGDFNKAIEILRKKGASVAAKRAERTANEGIVKTKVLDEGKGAVIVEVNCETDFVASSDDFLNFADYVLEAVIELKPASMDELMKATYKDNVVETYLSDVMGKIGEKIAVSRFKIESVEDGLLVDYVHHGAKLAVIVKAEKTAAVDSDKLSALLKDVAMQTAAMHPKFLKRDEVPADVIEKEKDIYKEVARKEGKPEQILDKIAEGKLNKYYQEACLLEQAYIKDNAKSIANIFEEFNKENSSEVELTAFYRFHLSDENK